MNTEDIWSIAGAVITSIGGSALLLAVFSSWLSKVWASRILEKDRAKYQTEIELLKSDLNKKIHEHNVAVSRIDAQRAGAIHKLYVLLIGWFEAALEIRAPNKLHETDQEIAIGTYQQWAKELRTQSEKLEKLSMLFAILLQSETYEKIVKCGSSASMLSIMFCDAALNSKETEPGKILEAIEAARATLEKEYQKDFEPARIALVEEFRSIMDPTIKQIEANK